MAVNAPLIRPMASDDFLGQAEWGTTPFTPITDGWQHIDEGVFTPNIDDNIWATENNLYILLNIYRDTIPENFSEAVALKINLYFSGFNLGSDPVVRFWLYTDYPSPLARQLGTNKKINLAASPPEAGGVTIAFDNAPLPSEDELKKMTLLLQTTTGPGGSHDPPYDPD